jgi:hypothetical protein
MPLLFFVIGIARSRHVNQLINKFSRFCIKVKLLKGKTPHNIATASIVKRIREFERMFERMTGWFNRLTPADLCWL